MDGEGRRHLVLYCICCAQSIKWKDLAKQLGIESRELYRYNPTLKPAYTQGSVVASGTVLYVPNATQAQTSTFQVDLPHNAAAHINVYNSTLHHLTAILVLTKYSPIRTEAHTWVPPGTTSHTSEITLAKDTSLLDIVESPTMDTKAFCSDQNRNKGNVYVNRTSQKTRLMREDPMKLTNISHAKTGALQANGTITHADTCASGGSYAPLKRVFLRKGTRIPQHTSTTDSEQDPPCIQCTFLHPGEASASWHPVVVDQRQYRVYNSLPHRLVLDRSGVLTVVGIHTVCEVTIDNRAYSLSFDTLWEALNQVYLTSDPPLPPPPQEASVSRVRLPQPTTGRQGNDPSLARILEGMKHMAANELTADEVLSCLTEQPSQDEAVGDLDNLGDMSFLLASPSSSPTQASNTSPTQASNTSPIPDSLE